MPAGAVGADKPLAVLIAALATPLESAPAFAPERVTTLALSAWAYHVAARDEAAATGVANEWARRLPRVIDRPAAAPAPARRAAPPAAAPGDMPPAGEP
jgi:hypothetical protein